MTWKQTRALVVGLKKSGLASAELLAREGAVVRATDLKPLAELPGAAETLDRLNIPFAQQTPDVFEGVELIVVSPDVPVDLPVLEAARARGASVIGDVELAAPFLKGRTIGITGSNGKTTTTSLIGHILKAAGLPCQVGGNIGAAVSGMTATSSDDGWNVLELSSFQLETIRNFRVHIALALNVTQNHLDRHHTFENYAAAKRRIVETQGAGDFAVLNAEDAVTVEYARHTAARVEWFSGVREMAPGAWLNGSTLMLDGAPLMDAAELQIRGRHNAENALAAAIAAARAGVPREAIAAAARTFQAVEHRLEFVRKVNGVDYFNDSKATSVDATLKALSAFERGLWVILGGKDKGSDYSPLRAPLAAKAHVALLVGKAAGKIAQHLSGAVPVEMVETVEAAVAYAYAHAAAGDSVVLAPACASFDQFRGYEHRGEVFKALVGGLKETAPCPRG